jgi:putative aminopeptidase FrvX
MVQKLMELTNLDGVSGDEQDVRNYILDNVKEKSLKYCIDSMGNLIVKCNSSGQNPLKVMLAAHMDEVGFMIKDITEDGKLKFITAGGMDSRILPGQHVRIGADKVPGVIAQKSIHLQDREERESVVKLKNLYIDIGATDRKDAEKYVNIGDYAAFASEPVLFGENRLKAKALDDRAGCVVLLELMERVWPFELYLCFTVQEEVGLRGARIAANRVEPDIGIVIEGTTCADVPGVKEHGQSTVLGKGPALSFADRTSIGDRELLGHFVKTAQEEKIPYQWKQTATGGNDAGRIQTSGTGVKVITVSVPCRYIHSPVSVLNINDLENMKNLVEKALGKLPSLEGGIKK